MSRSSVPTRSPSAVAGELDSRGRRRPRGGAHTARRPWCAAPNGSAGRRQYTVLRTAPGPGTALAVRFLGVGLLAGTVGGPAQAPTGEPLSAGTWELGTGAGYSVNHTGSRVEGLHLLPRVGRVATEPAGRGWLRGSLMILVEPTLLHLKDRDRATAGGLAILGRWVFATRSRVQPYFEVGGGVVGGEVNLRQTTFDVNFLSPGWSRPSPAHRNPRDPDGRLPGPPGVERGPL